MNVVGSSFTGDYRTEPESRKDLAEQHRSSIGKEIAELDLLIRDLEHGADIWVGSDAAELRHVSENMKKALRAEIIDGLKMLRAWKLAAFRLL